MKKAILVLSLIVSAPFAFAENDLPVVPGQVLSLHTGAVSNGLVPAYWNDHSFVMIKCSRGVIESTALLFFQNVSTKTIELTNPNHASSGRSPGDAVSPYLALDGAAVKAICNSPNGSYSLKVSTDSKTAQLLSTDDVEANSNNGYRGY